MVVCFVRLLKNCGAEVFAQLVVNSVKLDLHVLTETISIP